MQTVLVEAYLALNLGDDLFLKVLFERYPNLRFEIITRNMHYKEIFSKYSNVKINSSIVSNIQRKYAPFLLGHTYDAYVNIGGSIFMEYSNWQKHYNNRKSIIKSFSKQNKSTFILGSNFGPYLTNDFENVYHDLFSKCTDVCFRDQYSYNLFKDLSNVRVKPDIIFGLDYQSNKKIDNSLGLSLMDLSQKDDLSEYESDYISKMKEIIEEALERNMTIKLFSFCEKQGDLTAINKVLELISHSNKSNIEVLNYDGDMEEYLKELSSVELMIGTRFHACILSQVYNQGLYPIIYSQKTYNVLKDIKLDKEITYVQEIRNLNVKNLFSKIKDNKIKDVSIFKEAKEQFKGIDQNV